MLYLPKGSASCHALISHGTNKCLYRWFGSLFGLGVGFKMSDALIIIKEHNEHHLLSTSTCLLSLALGNHYVNAWMLHYDNAPAHTALNICQFFEKGNIATLKDPLYSPNLAPCNFFLFPKIKFVLKGTHFSDMNSIKMATTTAFKKIPENAFQECIESQKKRMHKYFKVEGNYFKGI